MKSSSASSQGVVPERRRRDARPLGDRVSEREVLRRRGRVHETEDRRVSVQRDEALAELDVGKRVSYDVRPLEPSSGARRIVFQQSRQFCIRLGVRVDAAILGL